MSRALLIVLDSVGIGGAPDAARYDDEGANTVGHIALACMAGTGDRAGLRSGPLHLPNLVALGLGEAIRLASGLRAPGLEGAPTMGLYGAGTETSNGKDTPSGHWEITGFRLISNGGTFRRPSRAFRLNSSRNSLRKPASRHSRQQTCLGHGDHRGIREDHCAGGMPILYTSADSVVQIAAHETTFGLARLYDVCAVMRELTRSLAIGRVIARPFVGETRGAFQRTANRKDWAIEPAEPTMLDRLTEAGRKVITIGKIGDIFAHRGTGEEIKAAGNTALLDAALSAFERLPDGGLVFANLIDFDVEFGHRRDVPGYAAALEAFDRRIPEILARLRPGDLAIITADHGNDPTWPGTDHTRERVPILAFGPEGRSGFGPRSMGVRESLADIAASILGHLGMKPGNKGISFL